MSLYPQNQEMTIYGKKILYPNVDENGKFTNGSFSDPKIKPSFIPAETLNLILDNLENIMQEAGIETNTEDADQLKNAVNNLIAIETQNRIKEDEALHNKLDKEITDRTNADTNLQNKLNQEITDRTNADTNLQNKLNQEITDRTNADTNLQNKLNQEITDRANAVTDLNNKITDTNNKSKNIYNLDSSSPVATNQTVIAGGVQRTVYRSIKKQECSLPKQKVSYDNLNMAHYSSSTVNYAVTIEAKSVILSAKMTVTDHINKVFNLNTQITGKTISASFSGQYPEIWMGSFNVKGTLTVIVESYD